MHDRAKKDKRTQIATAFRETQAQLTRLKRISKEELRSLHVDRQ